MLKKLGLHFGDNLFNRAKSPFIEIPECNIVISCTLMDSGFTTGAFDFIGFSIPRSKLANHFPTIGLDVRITLIRQEKQKHCSSCQRNKIDGNISSNDYHDVDAIPEDEARLIPPLQFNPKSDITGSIKKQNKNSAKSRSYRSRMGQPRFRSRLKRKRYNQNPKEK